MQNQFTYSRVVTYRAACPTLNNSFNSGCWLTLPRLGRCVCPWGVGGWRWSCIAREFEEKKNFFCQVKSGAWSAEKERRRCGWDAVWRGRGEWRWISGAFWGERGG